MIRQSTFIYGRSAKNCIEKARQPGIDGARALVETFYYAFNNRDMVVFKKVWADHKYIQLNNPLGGMVRGYEPIAALYGRIFNGPAKVWVDLGDIIEFEARDMVVFAGREQGEYSAGNEVLQLLIRTTRVVQWIDPEIGWRQTHHHGSIDDPQLLENYQRAVRDAGAGVRGGTANSCMRDAHASRASESGAGGCQGGDGLAVRSRY